LRQKNEDFVLELEENEPVSGNPKAKPEHDHAPISKQLNNRISYKPKEVVIL